MVLQESFHLLDATQELHVCGLASYLIGCNEYAHPSHDTWYSLSTVQ